jgi:hypothetical protein
VGAEDDGGDRLPAACKPAEEVADTKERRRREREQDGYGNEGVEGVIGARTLRTKERGRHHRSAIGSTVALSLLGRHLVERGTQRTVRGEIDWPVRDDDRARRILAETVVAHPVRHGPDGPWDEPAAAVRADVADHAVDNVAQKVHSKLQMYASSESGGSASLQCSHVGRSSSTGVSFLSEAGIVLADATSRRTLPAQSSVASRPCSLSTIGERPAAIRSSACMA